MKRDIEIFITFLLLILCITLLLNVEKVSLYIDNLFNEVLFYSSNNLVVNGNLVAEEDVDELEDSGIDGSNFEFSYTFYPYYEMLNTEQQSLYKQVYANALEVQESFVPRINIKCDDAFVAIEAVYNDHPELFWLNTRYSYKYTDEGYCVQVNLMYNEMADNLDYYKSLFEYNAGLIINEASKLSSNYEKEKYVHDVLVNNVSYDVNAVNSQSAYSALVNKVSVCAGYARAFQYIMIKLGIPTYYVSGVATEEHAWNIVELDDGYYNVDLTWNDQNRISYKYFNVSDIEFDDTHTRSELSSKLPSCNGSKYSNLESSNYSASSRYVYDNKGNYVYYKEVYK